MLAHCHESFHRLWVMGAPLPNQCTVSLLAPFWGLMTTWAAAPYMPLHPCPPHSTPVPSTKNRPESRPAVCRNQHPRVCGKGAVDTFVLVSLPLCFQSNRMSMNKHQTWNTAGPPVSPIFVPASSTWGLKRPLQHLKALCTGFCFQFSNPCCPCIRDSVLCWRTGEARSQPERCSH